ncbi:alpha/beta fold hydrolase [Labrenzia sp. PHM005]|uniref:alpha/beta fold hydrolase n=1 Tax=Labrenzia sp. PHM005 TaxID=2590016 RepID=UPI00113FEB9E|nr:alpha/beta hydrolase [Labrenzia sp. PHM005]QDG75879.1 alpha/beta hydrolase [Labrenzia sp. PHM005]
MTLKHLHIRDEGDGRPLVFLHGWTCPGVFFDPQVSALKGHARCIVPDLPGHGRSEDCRPLTIEASADAVYAYLEEKDLTDVVLCGWSMGALVAYSMIERHGADRISSVIAVDMSPKVLNDPGWSNGTLSGLTAGENDHFITTIAKDWHRLPGRIARRLFARGQEPELESFTMAKGEIASANPVLLTDMWMSLTALDFRKLILRFPVPLHLAAGGKSQLYGPGVHAWYQENVSDFHLTIFENSGHAPHLEEPEKFNGLLRQVIGAETVA